jgi:hypothetical protein
MTFVLNHERQKRIIYLWPYYLHNADNVANQNVHSSRMCKFKYESKEQRHMQFQNMIKIYFICLTWKQQKVLSFFVNIVNPFRLVHDI